MNELTKKNETLMKTKINSKWLLKNTCCENKKELEMADNIQDVRKICHWLLDHDRFKDANWILKKLLSKKNLKKYAIYAAKKVLYIFEDEFPDDNQPRKAIQAAERYLKNPTEKNKNAAAAYADAAYAAAIYTAYTISYASYTAADAAYAAAYAGYITTNTVDSAIAADTAYAAAAAAYVVADADVKKLKEQIINHGIKLLYSNADKQNESILKRP